MIRLGLGLLICAVFALGCQKRAEEMIAEKMIAEKMAEKMLEQQSGGETDVDFSKDGMTIKTKTKDGETTMAAGRAAKVPKDFPSDVYVYPGVTVVMASQRPDGYTLSLQTKDDLAKVAEAYKKEMTAKDWSQQSMMDMGKQQMLAYEKPDHHAHVTIAAKDGLTVIIIFTGKK